MKKKIDAEIVAQRIVLLWGFLADFIPFKELIKETAELASERHSFSISAAPIFGALGQDWEEQELETRIGLRRATALYNLVDVIDETEKERVEFAKSKAAKTKNLDILRRHLGM